MIAILAALLAAQDVASPLAPEAARREFRIDAGLRVDLVASEPEIESPVAMAFDEDGRLYVVEMLDYPTADTSKAPLGRIKVLEDKDGDGRYEHATVFATQLLMANGALPWKGGVIVTLAGQILYLKDTDGDGKADHREVLFEGFATGNPQLRASQPTLGLDGWVYVANGLRGGKIKSPKEGSKVVDINGMDFRFNMINGEYEAVSGMGQFGLTFDDWGNRFVCTNRNQFVHIPMEARYFARNPHLAAPPPVRDNNTPGGAARIFPLSKNKTLAATHAGTFTASCGVTIYRGDALPDVYRGNAFTCEPTGNLVHREIVTPSGATFVGKNAYPDREFLASPDGWFRPVNLAHGPDGALYVVDMYRPEVEHPEWVPADQRYRYNFDGPKNHGRIWRIVPGGPRKPFERASLSKASLNDLVSRLDDRNAWFRMTAHRLILERTDPADHDALRKAARSKTIFQRLHARYLLDSREGKGSTWVDDLLRHDSPRMREAGLILGERWPKDAADGASEMADDPDPRVVFQAALALGARESEPGLKALARIGQRWAEDRWIRLAVASSSSGRESALIQLVTHPLMLRELAVLLGSRKEPAEIAGALRRAQSLDAQARMSILTGLSEGLGRRGAKLSDFTASDPEAGALLEAAAALAGESGRPAAERLEAVRFLAHLPWPIAGAALEKLVAEPSQEIQAAAIAALSAHKRPEVAAFLLRGWGERRPALRREILEALARETDRTQSLLGEVEAGRIAPWELGTISQRLLNHKDAGIRERAKKLIQTARPEERLKVMEQYKPATAAKGDRAKGRAVFEKNCGSCHRIGTAGNAVGPDISDTLAKSKEILLADILDPSRAIDANYVNYLVRKKNGDIVTGFVAEQNASSVTLRRGADQQDVVLRQDIDEMKPSGLSAMPEGLEKGITVEEMGDLLAFLKNWRE